MKVINYDPEYFSGIEEIAEIQNISKAEKQRELLIKSLLIMLAGCIALFLLKRNTVLALNFTIFSVFIALCINNQKENNKQDKDSINYLSKHIGINADAIRYHKIMSENDIAKAELCPSEKGRAVLHLYKEDGGLVVMADEITFTCIMNKDISEEILDIGNGIIYIPLPKEKNNEVSKEKHDDSQ